jgi:hypothetical protein
MKDLNEFSVSLYEELQTRFPSLQSIYEANNGLLQANFPCPYSSLLGGMIVQTTKENDIWLRIHPACSAYSVDSAEELTRIMQEVLQDEIIWVIGFQLDAWAETTLIRHKGELQLESGIVYHLYSWSGKLDTTIKA